MLKKIVTQYDSFMNEKRRLLFADIAALCIRLLAGFMIAFGHGHGKLTGYADMKDKFMDFLGIGSPASLALAVFAEFFCGIAVMIGLGTRFAAIPLITTMLVAALIAHGADPFFSTGGRSKEFALIYLSSFLGIFFLGGGRFSLDYVIGRLLRR